MTTYGIFWFLLISLAGVVGTLVHLFIWFVVTCGDRCSNTGKGSLFQETAYGKYSDLTISPIIHFFLPDWESPFGFGKSFMQTTKAIWKAIRIYFMIAILAIPLTVPTVCIIIDGWSFLWKKLRPA